MELYFYQDCEYCQAVFETIKKLKISDEFTFKDIRVNPDYAKELIELTGNVTVPSLVNEQGPMKEAKDIRIIFSHILSEVTNSPILLFPGLKPDLKKLN
ncbi:MAG: hypothetical protein Ct9H300mP28_21980 [Pseudomonadota bacterium]|nr:MAG: hypothetical protein Ct9H300mP28_21980 [Pseudomonadota bacterium]